MSSNKIRDQTKFTSTTQNKRAKGRSAEDLAVDYLKDQGVEILERNRHIGRVGELDIVALQGELFLFIEVRSLVSGYIHPAQVLSVKKQRKLIILSRLWLKLSGLLEYECDWRIDLVTLSPKISWYKGIL